MLKYSEIRLISFHFVEKKFTFYISKKLKLTEQQPIDVDKCYLIGSFLFACAQSCPNVKRNLSSPMPGIEAEILSDFMNYFNGFFEKKNSFRISELEPIPNDNYKKKFSLLSQL